MHTTQRLLFSRSLIALMFLAGCSSNSEPPSSAPSAQASAAPLDVEVVPVTTQRLELIQTFPGELIPYESVAIHARTTGFVKSVSVDRGTRVRTGDLLAELEAPELAAQRSEAESKLAAAQSQLAAVQAKSSGDQTTYERLQAAARMPGVVAGNDLDLALRAAEASRANLAAAENSVKASEAARDAVAQIESYLRITAPFDGVITERNIHPGALVGPASGSGAIPMFRAQTLARLRLVVPIPESFVADVPSGTRVRFTVPAYPAETFQAPLVRVSHAIDTRTRTMPVELDVMNPNGRLTPGTFCQVQWLVRRSNATHFVPPTAVGTNQEQTFVIRIPEEGPNAGKAEWVQVTMGATAGNLVEVFGELKDGDHVVLRATDAIRPGSPLSGRVVSAAQ